MICYHLIHFPYVLFWRYELMIIILSIVDIIYTYHLGVVTIYVIIIII